MQNKKQFPDMDPRLATAIKLEVQTRYKFLSEDEKEVLSEIDNSEAGPVIRKLFGEGLVGLKTPKPKKPIERQMDGLMGKSK